MVSCTVNQIFLNIFFSLWKFLIENIYSKNMFGWISVFSCEATHWSVMSLTHWLTDRELRILQDKSFLQPLGTWMTKQNVSDISRGLYWVEIWLRLGWGWVEVGLSWGNTPQYLSQMKSDLHKTLRITSWGSPKMIHDEVGLGWGCGWGWEELR